MNIEEPNIEESIHLCGKRIFHFHVADLNRWYPGAGHLDFKSILSSLHSSGYKGFVSGEFLAQPDADTAASQGIAHLRAIQEEMACIKPGIVCNYLGLLVWIMLRDGV